MVRRESPRYSPRAAIPRYGSRSTRTTTDPNGNTGTVPGGLPVMRRPFSPTLPHPPGLGQPAGGLSAARQARIGGRSAPHQSAAKSGPAEGQGGGLGDHAWAFPASRCANRSGSAP